MEWLHLVVTLAGVLAGWLLFRKGRYVGNLLAVADISVVIPARNEAGNLPGLLDDIAKQTVPPREVIVVDDMSRDATAEVARQHGAALVQVQSKPAGWTGKSYACQQGAAKAKAGTLLFLDADVRLAPDALSRLAGAASDGEVISVQPYHEVKQPYEKLAFFFNLISVAALGNGLPFKPSPGLFGPAILIPRLYYDAIGGHESVKGEVVEDMALGEELDKAGLPYKRLLGGDAIRFRMYPGGVEDLVEGFVKNFATGAGKTSFGFFFFVALWIAALCRVPLQLLGLALGTAAFWAYIGLYLLCALTLWLAGRRIGSFGLLPALLYPLPLVFFVAVFVISIYKKLFRRPVHWKEREIGKEG